MATFTSKPVMVQQSAAAISDKFSDMTRLQDIIDRMPQAERDKVGDVELTADSIIINTKQVGAISLKVTERTESLVKFTAVGSPVPMYLMVNLRAAGPEETEVSTAMDVDIPPFLKPMVGGAMQKAVDQFGQLIAKLA